MRWSTKSVLLLLLIGTGLAQTKPAEAITISVLPTSQTAALGASVSVDIVIDGLATGAAPSLGSYDVDLTFNPAVLSFTGVTWGTGLDVFGLGSVRAATPGSGVLNLFEVSLDSLADLNTRQADAFVLATIAFSAARAGVSPLGLRNVTLADGSGAALSATVQGGTAVVGAVPEPASAWLAVVVAASLLRRRRRAAQVSVVRR